MNEDGLKIISDTINRSIEEVLKTMSRAESSALKKGANVIKKNTKSAFRKTGIKDIQNEKYSDRLIDAIRTSKVRNGEITVHIMGSRSSTSGTYRTRFFEGGTKERFQKTYKGRPLDKPRKLGKIDAYNFFNTALISSDQEVQKAMDDQLKKYIERAWNNNG